MRKIRFRFALANLALCSLAAACSSDDGGSNIATFSCLYSANDSCFEFVGPAGPSLDASRDVCFQLFRGTAGTGCARDDVSGSCAFPEEASRTVFYGLSSEELTLVQQTCEESNGVWSAN